MKKVFLFSFASKTTLASIQQGLLLLLLLAIFSCRQDDAQGIKPSREDPNWIRLEIPNGQQAYAIAGDIEQTLLVTTWTKAYYTTDQGKTWQESKDFQGGVPGLLVRNDTTFALMATLWDQTGQSFAGSAQYFTADYGRSWQYCSQYYSTYAGYQFYSGLTQPVGIVTSRNGITYRIKQNLSPDSPGSSSFYIHPSELTKESSFGSQPLRFPFQHQLMNLHLDANNRLYVAASGGTVTKENHIYCCEDTMPAIVYVSKKPLP